MLLSSFRPGSGELRFYPDLPDINPGKPPDRLIRKRCLTLAAEWVISASRIKSKQCLGDAWKPVNF